MKAKHKRLSFIAGGLGLLAAAVVLIFIALQQNLTLFFTPSELDGMNLSEDQRFRLGGIVEKGSVKKTGETVRFNVTDLQKTVPVTYTGILPDLFREGQGVVAQGQLKNGVFVANEVLAKHDETYMPKEVAEKLKESGQWKGPFEGGKSFR